MNKKCTFEELILENGEDYNPKDIRTYKGRLFSKYPNRDIYKHLTINPDYFYLTGTLEGTAFADDKVLYFPTSKDFKNKVILIKNIKLQTFYPSWLIEKYNIEPKDISYQQKTPIFYNVNTSSFFISMDEKFLDDIKPEQLNYSDFNDVQILKSKDLTKNYFTFNADTIEELIYKIKNHEGSYKKLKQNYSRLFINLKKGKRVIVLKFENDNQDTLINNSSQQFDIPNFSDKKAVFELMHRQKMEIESFQAVLVDQLFYLTDDNGSINSNAIIRYDESDTVINSNIKTIFSNGGDTYIVLDYTDNDWMLIKSIQEKLYSLCKELNDFFVSTKTEIGLSDKSFSDVPLPNSLKLLNKNN